VRLPRAISCAVEEVVRSIPSPSFHVAATRSTSGNRIFRPSDGDDLFDDPLHQIACPGISHQAAILGAPDGGEGVVGAVLDQLHPEIAIDEPRNCRNSARAGNFANQNAEDEVAARGVLHPSRLRHLGPHVDDRRDGIDAGGGADTRDVVDTVL
jgi:hypothetical protein